MTVYHLVQPGSLSDLFVNHAFVLNVTTVSDFIQKKKKSQSLKWSKNPIKFALASVTSLTLSPIVAPIPPLFCSSQMATFLFTKLSQKSCTFTLTNTFAWNVLPPKSTSSSSFISLLKKQLFRDAFPEFPLGHCHPVSHFFPSLLALSTACQPTY